MNIRQRYLFWIFLLLSPALYAQELGGLWRGHMQTGKDTLPYEVVISGRGDTYTGYAMTTFRIADHDNIGIKTVKFKFKKGYLTFMDEELIFDNYEIPPKKVIVSGRLYFLEKKDRDELSGEFFSRVPGFRPSNDVPDGGLVFLVKLKDTASSFLMAKLKEMNKSNDLVFAPPKQTTTPAKDVAKNDKPQPKPEAKPDEPVVAKVNSPVLLEEIEDKPKKRTKPVPQQKPPQDEVAKNTKQTPENKPPPPITKPLPDVVTKEAAIQVNNRKTEIIQEVEFTNDSLVLTLYDNGSVDGDTVSVLLNNQVIIAKQRLTTQPIRHTIYITPELGESLQVIMYAENLGDIPPNTGLLIVQDGDRRHDIRFAGDLQKSSAIILKRKR